MSILIDNDDSFASNLIIAENKPLDKAYGVHKSMKVNLTPTIVFIVIQKNNSTFLH